MDDFGASLEIEIENDSSGLNEFFKGLKDFFRVFGVLLFTSFLEDKRTHSIQQKFQFIRK